MRYSFYYHLLRKILGFYFCGCSAFGRRSLVKISATLLLGHIIHNQKELLAKQAIKMNVDKKGENVIQIGYGPAHIVEKYNSFVHSLSKRARREKILHKHDDLSD